MFSAACCLLLFVWLCQFSNDKEIALLQRTGCSRLHFFFFFVITSRCAGSKKQHHTPKMQYQHFRHTTALMICFISARFPALVRWAATYLLVLARVVSLGFRVVHHATGSPLLIGNDQCCSFLLQGLTVNQPLTLFPEKPSLPMFKKIPAQAQVLSFWVWSTCII